MPPRELWEHVPTGKKIVVETNEEGRVVGWYGSPDSDVESALGARIGNFGERL